LKTLEIDAVIVILAVYVFQWCDVMLKTAVGVEQTREPVLRSWS